jgi:hypothetical protein
MSSEIRLVPSWYGKKPLAKESPKLESENSTICYGGNDNDNYVSPIYNETKEFISNLKPYNKLPSLDEKFELDDTIRPLYKHLLNGSEFYRFYLNKVRNVVLDRIPIDHELQPSSNQSVKGKEISSKTSRNVILQEEEMLDEPIEDMEKYNTNRNKVLDDYDDDFNDRNYTYSDDDYNVYSDFEVR